MNIVGRLSLVKVILILVGIVAFFSAVAMTVTSQTGFCNSCHIMNDYYASWERSSHSDVSCLSCHLQPGFNGYIKGKVNGLAQAVDCMVGRVGTKAEATVFDQSCLRSACHRSEDLDDDSLEFGSVKFSHKGHIGEVYDGINVTCGTCHNHTHGEEHFSVNNGICYTCHFLKNDADSSGLVRSECLDCHTLPEQIIDRGTVIIDHQEFKSYDVNCESSCHQRQIERVSQVTDTACLQCHTFGLSDEETSEQLHAYHTDMEKVECFACHGKVPHGPDETSTVATMMNCENCHSNTHAVQKTIFSADQSVSHETAINEKVLSPMFLTHVECTGCHVERDSLDQGTLSSVGTVARAIPAACDTCHEPGTGQRYIPFWQKNIKSLYQQVEEQVNTAEQKVALLDDESQKAAMNKLSQVQSILESVKADGSWGVHNLKYTEALLLDAKKLLNEI